MKESLRRFAHGPCDLDHMGAPGAPSNCDPDHTPRTRGEIMKSMLIAASAGLAMTAAASAQSPQFVMEEVMVPSSEAGIEIYVRNKRLADRESFRPERTVLYVHGATYPASTAFDLKLDGLSWMEYIAARGYDVYLLDLRGYGKSVRPKEMGEAAETSAPIVRGDTAIKDIASV